MEYMVNEYSAVENTNNISKILFFHALISSINVVVTNIIMALVIFHL